MPIKLNVSEPEPVSLDIEQSKVTEVPTGGTTNHSQLTNLDYSNSGHTGFVSATELPAKLAQYVSEHKEELKGDKGDKGDQGPKGDQGLQGPQGMNGAKGETGPRGEKGETGSAGAQGPRGETGPAGTPGVDGADGAPGAKGADGYAPVRGTDYWTAEDVAAIKAYVDAAILGGEW